MTEKSSVTFDISWEPQMTRSRGCFLDSSSQLLALSYTPAGEDVVQVMGTSGPWSGASALGLLAQCQKQRGLSEEILSVLKRLVLFSRKSSSGPVAGDARYDSPVGRPCGPWWLHSAGPVGPRGRKHVEPLRSRGLLWFDAWSALFCRKGRFTNSHFKRAHPEMEPGHDCGGDRNILTNTLL